MISGFRREVTENCSLPGYYAASCVISYRRFGTTYRRIVRMAGHAARMRKARNEVGILFGNREVIEYGRCGSVMAVGVL